MLVKVSFRTSSGAQGTMEHSEIVQRDRDARMCSAKRFALNLQSVATTLLSKREASHRLADRREGIFGTY